jgi:hypothetical protein
MRFISVYHSFPFLYCVAPFLHLKNTIFELHIYFCIAHFPQKTLDVLVIYGLIFCAFLFYFISLYLIFPL